LDLSGKVQVVRIANYSGSVLTTDQKGAIAESQIVAELIKLGIDVYKPVAEGGRCDLILEVGSTLLRTQCKWAPLHADVVLVRCYSCPPSPRGVETTLLYGF
jgi:PD-(D/E)XK endonuclease